MPSSKSSPLLRTTDLKCKLNPWGGKRVHLSKEVNENQNVAAYLSLDHPDLYIWHGFSRNSVFPVFHSFYPPTTSLSWNSINSREKTSWKRWHFHFGVGSQWLIYTSPLKTSYLPDWNNSVHYHEWSMMSKKLFSHTSGRSVLDLKTVIHILIPFHLGTPHFPQWVY